jgi:hypothetical protein
LVHRNAGRRSNHAKSEALRRRVIKIVREEYGGEPGDRLGPTLAAEHLGEDHGLKVDAETLRRWMLEAGLWSRDRKRKAYRQRRARRRHFGELVQMDGSFEAWLEGRAERGCLINMVDDATSRGLGHFDQEETTWALADAYRAWVEKYGIARALYVDGKTVYGAWASPEQMERVEEPFSQFRRMCERLGTELILAGSAQVKGRVERVIEPLPPLNHLGIRRDLGPDPTQRLCARWCARELRHNSLHAHRAGRVVEVSAALGDVIEVRQR